MVLALLLLAPSVLGKEKGEGMDTAPAKVRACTSCHTEVSSALKKGHPKVNGNTLESCLGCHKLAIAAFPAAKSFSTRIHRAHVMNEGMECTACHEWGSDGVFGLKEKGQRLSYGIVSAEDMSLLKRVFASWVDSPYLDSIHGRGNVSCSACHASPIPVKGSGVPNSQCMACHGAYE